MPQPTPSTAMSLPPSYLQALDLIDSAHSQDPDTTTASAASSPVPRELHYARGMTTWLHARCPTASPELQLACRAQHFKRWQLPRSTYPMTRSGYLTWRAKQKAQAAANVALLLADPAIEPPIAPSSRDRVAALIRKDGLATDPDTQVLEDVACLVFLDDHFDDFEAKADMDEAKLITILRKTWAKMSEPGRELALAMRLSDKARSLIASVCVPASPEVPAPEVPAPGVSAPDAWDCRFSRGALADLFSILALQPLANFQASQRVVMMITEPPKAANSSVMTPGMVQGEGGAKDGGAEDGGPGAGEELGNVEAEVEEGEVEAKDEEREVEAKVEEGETRGEERDEEEEVDGPDEAEGEDVDDLEWADAEGPERSRVGAGKEGDSLALGDAVGSPSVEAAVYRRTVSATLSVPQTKSEKPPRIQAARGIAAAVSHAEATPVFHASRRETTCPAGNTPAAADEATGRVNRASLARVASKRMF
ncbi:glutamyl-tRNA synthetase [Hirsutella rhossiliensis]|uniref:Glutamyl-tRNA synthetase n=1 Tax=Hirsutella rhossiliensis TaxID=111463 RepID=A0A9P8N571_9HYPO|nr:glutamyl-tRNA synthetase [Hirsutella rhossiliensis]KAH0964857.1 glutamyl-tRNA synthetase [Hirsutella rhossiliensis]